MAEALQSDKVQHSFDRENSDFSVFDRQLIRCCKGSGVVCLPLQIEGQLLGGIALGIANASEAESLASPQIQLLNKSIARALASVLASRAERQKFEPADGDNDLIPKLVHEISNPLTIINNYVNVVGTLLEGTENAEILPAIENEIRRIGEILKYYSDLKNRPQLPDAAINLNDLIHSVVERLNPICFVPKKIDIHTDFDNTIRPMKTKAVAIKQILINLLKNAAEALSKDGKIIVTTRYHTASDGQHAVEITVQDNGPGIDMKIQERLFSPVTSTKGGGHAGLGLNIIKGMVEDIGAKISCHSSAKYGTRFNLVIPLIDK